MVSRILYRLLILITFIALSATNAWAQQQSFSKNLSSSKEIYESFLYEKSLCHAIVAVLQRDKNLAKDLINANEETTYGHIAASQVASELVIQYLLEHRKYLFIGVDSHGGPGYVYATSSVIPVFCAPTLERLREIESLGPSEYAWNVRASFLNDFLANLYIPSLEPHMEIGIDFSFLADFFYEAILIYDGPAYKGRIRAWAGKVSKHIKTEIDAARKTTPEQLADRLFCKHCKGAGDKPSQKDVAEAAQRIDDHIKTLEGWIKYLNERR